jgi:hypothetical protein
VKARRRREDKKKDDKRLGKSIALWSSTLARSQSVGTTLAAAVTSVEQALTAAATSVEQALIHLIQTVWSNSTRATTKAMHRADTHILDVYWRIEAALIEFLNQINFMRM